MSKLSLTFMLYLGHEIGFMCINIQTLSQILKWLKQTSHWIQQIKGAVIERKVKYLTLYVFIGYYTLEIEHTAWKNRCGL